MESIGVVPNAGLDNGNLMGSAWAPLTQHPVTKHRDSSKTSFLATAMQQTSIKVYHHALAKKVLFDNITAVGVLVETGGKPYILRARREVILSAGAIQSPQLLMVSGVGPKDVLDGFNITTISDLPGVGQNMWDHPIFSVSYRVQVQTASTMINNPKVAAAAAAHYLTNATGPLTAAAGFLGFEKLPEKYRMKFSSSTSADLSRFPPDWPELEYLAVDTFRGDSRFSSRLDPRDGYNYASLSACLAAPTSRGSVTISSADTIIPPVIDLAWLTTNTDVELAIAGFKRLRQMWSNLSDITIGSEYYPASNVVSDEDIISYIRKTMTSLFHASSTCSMGTPRNKEAVVDTKARVYGVKSLRIVDASIIPFLHPGHPQAVIYALAEKIADDIKYGSTESNLAAPPYAAFNPRQIPFISSLYNFFGL